jgi:hypothetical protein
MAITPTSPLRVLLPVERLSMRPLTVTLFEPNKVTAPEVNCPDGEPPTVLSTLPTLREPLPALPANN